MKIDVIGYLIISVVAILGFSLFGKIFNDADKKIIPAIGNSIENIEALKSDCEKSLPRDQECVMVYDFVPVKKESE